MGQAAAQHAYLLPPLRSSKSESFEAIVKAAAGEKDFRRGEASRVQHFRFALAVSRERETGADILFRQIGKIPQNILVRHATGEIFQHVIDGDAQPADARLPASFAGLHCNDA